MIFNRRFIMFRKTKIALALTLALTLCLSLIAPISLAAQTPQKSDATQAAITKIVRVPYGTNAPTAEFKFGVKPISHNDDETTTAIATMPVIGAYDTSASQNVVKINYPDTAVPAAKGLCQCDPEANCPDTPDTVEHYYLESDHLFSGSTDWKFAGIYVYEIWEIPNTFTGITGETMSSYSSARYMIKVYVKEVGGAFVITNIAAYRTYDDSGKKITREDKVDPSPNPDPGNPNGKFSEMRFTNTYYKHNGVEGTDPLTPAKQTLVVKKEVTGEFSSRNMYFSFEITVKKHELVKGDITYKAYLVDASGPVKTFTSNGAAFSAEPGTGNGIATITLTDTSTSGSLSFKLKHGEKLVFTNVHVGTTYEVTELGAKGYTAKATVTTAGAAVTLASNGEGVKDNGLSIPTGTNPPPLRVGENTGKNEAFFLNETTETVEAGLNISDLPFYGMLFLAVAGLVTFVVIKARSYKNKEDYHV